MVWKKACRIHSECHRSMPRGCWCSACPEPPPPGTGAAPPPGAPSPPLSTLCRPLSSSLLGALAGAQRTEVAYVAFLFLSPPGTGKASEHRLFQRQRPSRVGTWGRQGAGEAASAPSAGRLRASFSCLPPAAAWGPADESPSCPGAACPSAPHSASLSPAFRRRGSSGLAPGSWTLWPLSLLLLPRVSASASSARVRFCAQGSISLSARFRLPVDARPPCSHHPLGRCWGIAGGGVRNRIFTTPTTSHLTPPRSLRPQLAATWS